MKLTDLINILNISIEELKEYEKFFDHKFNLLEQTVPDKICRDLFKIYKVNLLKNSNMQILYQHEDILKFNAFVMWYFDKKNNGEYGFVQKKGWPNIFFSKKACLKIDPANLIEGDEVIVTINKKNLKNYNLKAISILPIKEETDINYLLFYYLRDLQNPLKNNEKLFNQILKCSNEIDKNAFENELIYLKENIKFQTLSNELFIKINKLLKIFDKNINEFNIQVLKLNSDKIFNLWIAFDELQIEFQFIKNEIVKHINENFNEITIKNILNRLSIDNKKIILDCLFIETCDVFYGNSYNKIKSILKYYNLYEISIDYTIIPDEKLLFLWENKTIDYFPFNLIYDKFIDFKNEYYKNDKREKSSNAVQYLKLIKQSDLKDILSKTHFEKEKIDDKETFETILFFISHMEDTETRKEFISKIYNKIDGLFKIELFILDFTDEIDYYEVLVYTALLSAEKQKLFFKKTLKLIDENKIDLTLEDLNKLTTIDFQTSEIANADYGIGLDYTLSIVLKVAIDLKNKEITKRNTIFNIISNQVKKPSDLLEITGFFEKCSGRTIIEKDYISKDKEGKAILDEKGKEKVIYKETKKEHLKPRFSTFCDGRKSINKFTNQPNLCKESGKEFWWCENQKCYEICRTEHTPAEWKDYSLADVLRILKIPYDEIQYEILLNVINRVNRFLKHLTCKKCNLILKPTGKSNYAFYGVTWFKCDNENCEEHRNEIYLSHCLNGKCNDIIDSRDSVKCKPEGHSQDCGWFVCKNCYACCSSEKLNARKENLKTNGYDYNCHLDGHSDKQKICCFTCGIEMNEKLKDNELYNLQLEWAINTSNAYPENIRTGLRLKDGKRWFFWTKGALPELEYRNGLKGLLATGFVIPKFDELNNFSQFISEPFDNDKVFECSQCNHQLNLKNNEEFPLDRIIAIQNYHNKIFPPIKAVAIH